MLKKILTLAALLACITSCSRIKNSAGAKQHTVVDMAGRTLVVPTQIHKVLGMSPVGTILVYTLDPDLVAGWNYVPDSRELAYYAEPYRHLPVLGGWYGKNNSGNLETIVKAKPDLILSMGDAMGQQMADRIQQQTHIPVYILDGGLDKLPQAYQKAGELFGRQERAQLLAAECRRTLDEVRSKIQSIPAEKRRRVYYAEGPAGLATEPADSMHFEAMAYSGGHDVADVPNQQGYGQTPVSLEQVLKWNPEVIITGYDHASSPGEFYKKVWNDPAWKRVAAVRNRQVYEAPQYPFNWVDRPPSANRIIGLRWLANIFYPELFHDDLRAETRHFYQLFYHVNLTEQQLDQIFVASKPNLIGKK